jgi:hypothetical protein
MIHISMQLIHVAASYHLCRLISTLNLIFRCLCVPLSKVTVRKASPINIRY